MGNNNATAIVREEESSKLESNGMSPLGSVSVDTTQDQVFLAGEGKDGDEEKESSKLETNGMSLLDSVSVETAQDELFLAGNGNDGDEEKEISKLETNGMSLLASVSVENTQDQVFLADEGKEKGSPKLETNGMSPLDPVSVKTTQDQWFLADERKDGDEEKEISKLETNGTSPLESISLETTRELFLAGEGKDGDAKKESMPNGVKETEPQSKELVAEPKVKLVEEEMHPSGLESLAMETDDEELKKQTSDEEGVETVFKAIEVEELSMVGTQSVVRNLNTTESGNEENHCVIDETVGNEEKMVNESSAEIVSTEEVVNLDQETGVEQRTRGEGFPEIEPQEILNLDYHVVVDDEEVKETSKVGSEESNAIQESGLGVHKEEKYMDLNTEASLKRMSRCRSLPVSHNSRVIGDSLVQQLVAEVVFSSRNKMCLEKANTSEAVLVPCVGSNKVEETNEAITESSKEATLEIRSPSFSNDLRIEERSDESTEKTPLLFEDKTEIYETTIDVEEKTVMLKRSESVKTRCIDEKSPGLLNKQNDSFKEIKGSEDNLVDKKASLGSMKKRSKSSLLGTCLCCTTAMN